MAITYAQTRAIDHRVSQLEQQLVYYIKLVQELKRKNSLLRDELVSLKQVHDLDGLMDSLEESFEEEVNPTEKVRVKPLDETVEPTESSTFTNPCGEIPLTEAYVYPAINPATATAYQRRILLNAMYGGSIESLNSSGMGSGIAGVAGVLTHKEPINTRDTKKLLGESGNPGGGGSGSPRGSVLAGERSRPLRDWGGWRTWIMPGEGKNRKGDGV